MEQVIYPLHRHQVTKTLVIFIGYGGFFVGAGEVKFLVG